MYLSPIPRRTAVVGVVTLTLCALLAVTAFAHDFWLVPNAFRVAAGGTVEVRGQTSSRFPTSESAVTPDRVAEARLVGARQEHRIGDLSQSGKSLVLRHKPSTPGQYVVAVALHPRSVRESAAGFRRYLELEGAAETLAQVEREGLLRDRDSVTRRYAKYAKTLVQIGEARDPAFFRVAGHPLEFIPLKDPASVNVGDTLEVRLVFDVSSAAGFTAHAGAVDWPMKEATAPQSDGDVRLSSDARGVLRIPITRPGLWNVRTVHVVPAKPNSGADWDTHWATLVFQVAGSRASGTSAGQATDSAAAVAAVQRFHRALAEGDSATALALMTNDAVVLESGDMETRAEYQAHHLPADIEFARAVPAEYTVRRVSVRGDAAWVSSTSTTRGEFRGRQINSVGAELAVLVRTGAGWRISAIHWSSRARRG